LTFAEEGIDVITVGDGEAALREIAVAHPDIVLADVHMPGPSGYEICSLLRGVEETSKIPVILLVGSFEQFDPEEAEKAGADAFVTKPFQPIRQLVEQVKELLERSTNVDLQVEEMPQVEPANAEPVRVGSEFDTTDIDSLYNQSFAETVEMGPEVAAEIAGAAYVSDRLDDEMIETSYTAEQPNEQIDLGSAAGSDQFYDEPPLDIEATQYSAAPSVRSEEIIPGYEETLQMDTPPAMATEQSFAHSAHTAPTEELRRDLREPFATTTDAFDLDDIDLLDLTPENATQEYTITTPSDAVSQGSNKQVVTLSPELLEVIVQKVVEKISEKY
jgi:CheY-like chemotaxis protein